MKLKYVGVKFSPIVVLIKRKNGKHFTQNVNKNEEFEAPEDVAYKILSKYNTDEVEMIVPVGTKVSVEDAQDRVVAAERQEAKAAKAAEAAKATADVKDDEEL